MTRVGILAVLLAGWAAAQFSAGVKGGVALTDALETSGNVKSDFKNWVVGPVIEVGLPLGLGVEVDALYRRTGFITPGGTVGANSWELPLIFKYKFPGIVARPYVGGGPVFRTFTGITKNIPGVGAAQADLPNRGFAIAGGVRIGLPFIKLWPELRYTWWDKNSIRLVGPAGSLNASPHVVDVLVGITF